MKLSSEKELEDLRNEIISGKDPDKPCIAVCGGTGCHASGCSNVAREIQAELDSKNLKDKVDLRITGCHGFCERGPIVIVFPEGIFYQKVIPRDVKEIIASTVENGKIVDRLLYQDPVSGEKKVHVEEITFYHKQNRLLLENNTRVDPAQIKDYLAIKGYSALAKVL
ncbi:partial NADH-quinone oxidoreductase subunit E, partial [Methanosarcinales archaeon]